ncbi:fibronectin type III domain-containing protein [Tenacibaculum sp. SDUM215027]|uniref:fibronectin type III domain-containing protein n=1 Tax=Tenacibaculum sp. SDUM215027 TaxID=3422596 RepID=UPI003D3211E6
MKRLFAVSYLLVVNFLVTQGVFSQVKESKNESSVQILARVQKDKILLRWAATTANAWKKTNKNGFTLKKYVLSRNGKRLPSLEKVWEKNIQAAPVETWQEIVEKDNNAAIIAQALFGESFFVEGGSEGQLADIYNLVNENEQRFSFSLLAADMSFEAAKKAGWGFEDTDVKLHEKYVYKIKPAIIESASKTVKIKGTAAIASIKEYEPLPAPIDFQGIFGDKNVILTWEYQLFKTIYTSYNLERSEDGVNFTPLSKEPLVNLNDKPEAPAKRMFYIDSLANNTKTYYYRVNGISPFGEKGLYSKIISGQGKPILPYTPRVFDVQLTKNTNEAIITWEFPKKGETLLEKFQLLIAPVDKGPYVVAVDNISPQQRKLTYSKLQASNYVKIKAIGKDPKQEKTSFSTLIQPLDRTPPAIPTELSGKIDSLGVVHITWKQNIEPDFLGYRVFRGFLKDEEPSQITVSPINQNSFIDTVTVKNLNAEVFYSIVAVDKRHNHSEKSEVLMLEKPDVIPPTAPVFSGYKIKEGKVIIEWIPSSEDNATHVLLRENLSEKKELETIFTTNDTVRQYIDAKLKSNNRYRYHMKAIDKSGLTSLPSSPLTIEMVNLTPKEYIKGLDYVVNRETNHIELFWRANNDEIAEYTIYKQLKEKQPSTWRILPAGIKNVIDKEVSPNETYIYHIRATLKKGGYAKVKTIEIKF